MYHRSPDSGHVTKFSLLEALKLIARGKLTSDERGVLHRVAGAARDGVVRGDALDDKLLPPLRRRLLLPGNELALFLFISMLFIYLRMNLPFIFI